MDDNREKIPIATDHGGYETKEYLKQELEKDGYDIVDYGTFSDESVDYPDTVHPLAADMNRGRYRLGIILCGSGNGSQMVANKYPNIRAALCWNVDLARLAREHNDANVISLPGRFVSKEEALEMARVFLKTDFEGGRHSRRVRKINKLK